MPIWFLSPALVATWILHGGKSVTSVALPNQEMEDLEVEVSALTGQITDHILKHRIGNHRFYFFFFLIFKIKNFLYLYLLVSLTLWRFADRGSRGGYGGDRGGGFRGRGGGFRGGDRGGYGGGAGGFGGGYKMGGRFVFCWCSSFTWPQDGALD